MGTRGPKPVDIGLLNMWEFEWFKALHLLREGKQLPEPELWTLEPEKVDARVRVLQKLTLGKIVGEEPPPVDWEPSKVGDRAPLRIWERWAEGVREQRIAEILAMKPREVYARAERREIWNSLWRARTRPALDRACAKWKGLADVQAIGMSVFVDHVLANAKAFLEITRNPRFPRSAASDDSRLDNLARGMAGVMAGVSPMTGMERLRNMSHGSDGPLWRKGGGGCCCWRCDLRKWEEDQVRIQAALEAADRAEDV